MASRGFKITPLDLKTGRSWLVTGTLNRRQIRRQFAQQKEAEKFRNEQDAILFGRDVNKAPVRTHLSNPQIQEAEAVFARLNKDHPGMSLMDLEAFHGALAGVISPAEARSVASALSEIKGRHSSESLAAALLFYLRNYRAPAGAKTVHDALAAYLEERMREHEKGSLRNRQFTSIGLEMDRFEQYFGGKRAVAAISHLDLQDYLRKTFPADADGRAVFSNKTWNNRRSYLSTFFGFCVTRGWRRDNPALEVSKFRKAQLAKKEIVIRRADQALELMRFVETFAEGRLVPFFALTLFTGIRPDYRDGEISKFKPEFVHLDDNTIRLPWNITKTKKPRHITIQPNLAEWLKAYPLDEYPILCRNFKRLYVEVRKRFKLEHDVLRHTFCSMLVAHCRNVGEASLQAGNTPDIIWESYLKLVSPAEAEQFWSIRPLKRMPAPSQDLLPSKIPAID